MVKKASLFFLIGLFSVLPLTAQERAVEVLNEVYCLGTRACSPQTSVAFELPPNTVKWFYTVNTTKKRRKARQIKKNPALRAIFSENSLDWSANTGKLSEENPPVFWGDGNCSVYLLKHYSDSDNFGTAGGVYFYYPQYSKKDTPFLGMIVDESILCWGTQYIGIENPNAFAELENVYAVLTVVAIVRVPGSSADQ